MFHLAVLTLSCSISLSEAGYLSISGKDFTHNGAKVFLSGANTAWVSYGYDFGNRHYNYYVKDRYHLLLDKVKDAGGNSMRTWIHMEGVETPQFDGNCNVVGLDHDGSFLDDIKQYLDDAKERNILIFFTLWNGAVEQTPEHLRCLMKDPSKLQTYIDKALKPWVTAVKDHPAVGGWDIINEMDGFIIPGKADPEPCYDTSFLTNSGAGWAGQSYTAQEILRFINLQVNAIHEADPTALVTAGSWSQRDQSDQWNDKNLYSDRCLTLAGGKSGGTLDFYSTHAYAWQNKFADDAVFLHDNDDYKLDKPLVVAEFNQNSGAGMTIEEMFAYVYEHGYAGAWSWHANADGSNTDPTDVQMRGIAAVRSKSGVALSL